MTETGAPFPQGTRGAVSLRVEQAQTRAFDFVALGECSLDTVCIAEAFPAPDSKIQVERRELPGGQAATAAVACARLGLRSRYVGVIGSDDAGRRIRQACEEEGVDTQLLVRGDVATRSAVIILAADKKSRTVLETRAAALDVTGHEIPDDVFASGRVLLVDGTDPALSLRALAVARQSGVRTMLDVDLVNEQSLRLVGQTDVAIVPASFVGFATGGRDLASLARLTGCRVIVATDGARGAAGWIDGREVHVSAPSVEVSDTTGAGDAFRAGFAAAWLASAGKEPDLVELLEVAVEVGSLACRAVGAQTALPRRHELSARTRDRV